MAVDNKESVAKYHLQIKDMKIKFPRENPEKNIPDYTAVIKDQSKKLGKASMNEYILELIEADIRNNPNGIHDETFQIKRSVK